MHLNQSQVAHYHEHGYVILENVFNQTEVDAMIHEIEHGSRVQDGLYGREDASGRKAQLALWHEPGDDIWGKASIAPGIVNNVRILLGEEAAFFHGKVSLKEAKTGGSWEWHQDYGYWYNAGFVFPHMISAFIALDPNTKANGCLQVLKGSHKLGRINHGQVGDQTGTEANRIEMLESHFERVYCEMEPGSVLFFHCNLLHASGPNDSDQHRRSFIVCFNALANPQLDGNSKQGGNVAQQVACPTGQPGDVEALAKQILV